MKRSLDTTKPLEEQIIGRILNEHKFIFACHEFGLKPHMFANYRQIYEEITRRVNNNHPYDLASLNLALNFNKTQLDNLVDIQTEGAFSSVNLKPTMKNLKFFADQQETERIILKYRELVKTASVNEENSLSKIKGQIISALADNADSLKSRDMIEYFPDILDDYENALLGKHDKPPLCTGNNALDEALGMYCDAKYVTIMAETGIGKSTFALNIATNMVERGRKIAYFTQEMTPKELVRKYVLRKAGLGWKKYMQNQYTETELDKLRDVCIDQYKTLRGRGYIDFAHPDIDDIILESLSLINTKGIEAIFIDYIQQLECGSLRTFDPREIMIAVSKKILKFSLQQNIPIFVVAQLNRAAKSSEPGSLINNVADSSNISKDTTYGLAVVAEYYTDGQEKGRFLYKTKGRHGVRGALNSVTFNKHTHAYNTDY